MSVAANDEPRMDGLLLAAVLALVGVGLVMVYSSSAVFAARNFGSGTHFLAKQAVRVALGGVAFFGAAYLPRNLLRQNAVWILGAVCVLCVAVLIPGIGHEA
ncbi:MAG: FtsW/RodA/SpoVE family cell cycle protein, partial [Myxococcota bacterium]